MEHDIQKVPGVIDAVSGYAGGESESPTYEKYNKGRHREAVLVRYDFTQVSFIRLVEYILKHGNPTDPNGSFGDRGAQYASAIYYDTQEEKKQVEQLIAKIDSAGVY